MTFQVHPKGHSCHATQLDLTALFTGGESRKERGIAKAASARQQLVEACRRFARSYARERGTVTADDVQAWLVRQGKSSADLGIGSLGTYGTA